MTPYEEKLVENFKTLMYDMGEVNWGVLKTESWIKFINNNEPFTAIQLNDIKYFLDSLADDGLIKLKKDIDLVSDYNKL